MKLYYSRFKKWMVQEKVRRILNAFIVVWATVLVSILAFLSINDTALSRVLGLSTQATPTPSATPTFVPLLTNTPILTPTSVPRQNTYDPDPIIDCKSDNLGVLRIRRSECTKGTECDLGNNRWIFAATKAECVVAQNAADTGNPPQQNYGTSEPTVTCVMPYGTYQIPKSLCDYGKRTLESSGSQSEAVVNQFIQDAEEIVNRKFEVDPINVAIPAWSLPPIPSPTPLPTCAPIPPGWGGFREPCQ